MREIKEQTDGEKIAHGIFTISQHYSQENQLKKAIEELKELLYEYENAIIKTDGTVTLAGNYVSETADMIIMSLQVIMQHGHENDLIDQMKYKIERQFRRMENE